MMLRLIMLTVLLAFSAVSLAADDTVPVALSPVLINLHDRASILRGAKFFANTCMVCHTMKYLRHNNIASEAGITLDKMPLKNKEWWLGIAPPDLTLIAEQRGPDWIYTYLHSFYKDASRPTGFNNLLVKNSVMANILLPFQGQQVLIKHSHSAIEKLTGKKPPYYAVLKMVRAGSMTPEQFNRTMTDLVNFLVYASEPHAMEREYLGYWVLGFLLIMIILSYLLYKVYWKDIH